MSILLREKLGKKMHGVGLVSNDLIKKTVLKVSSLGDVTSSKQLKSYIHCYCLKSILSLEICCFVMSANTI